MKAQKIPRYTIAEYISLEKEANTKYEYHDGKVFALAGGSINHGLLCGNIYSELRNGLEGKGSNCKTLTSEIKLKVKGQNSFVYPDSMVICGEIETSKEEKNSVTNPILIVEVMSKSTSNYDRGDKFFLYKKIPSLQEYVLIEQDKSQIDVFYKKPGSDLWLISRYETIDSKLELRSINIEIEISKLYFDIVF